ncbi:MAG TPA: PEGA domain-containing protein [Polyangiaceae bacterium LLY-WYZ-15_(1-7)]|nr:hypothetical protein [Myxococcales bacterium]MBJ70859.1 hypothetical protein [Sandaracinus sp.]HJL03008.1 PEGA domain-containing protein [Polyangiaceae bacterium LLY-WYZ-15_(1-7)]HJL13604.1 PEGA domain-containing protein [Polyangiaceae bacterium LLY-WYZ-15_(1-7)]HJL21806.1 PEGA domain-containing protein [Polyangiaceae bacterium LLY-WYZ-15_(1-7)]
MRLALTALLVALAVQLPMAVRAQGEAAVPSAEASGAEGAGDAEPDEADESSDEGEESAESDPSDEDATYWHLVRAAIRESSAQRYDEALALFRRAHAIRPSARTLRGLGMVHYARADYVDAVDRLERALADTRRPLNAEEREEARLLIAEARAYVARVRVFPRPIAAVVRVDGVRSDARGPVRDIPVNPGRHQLVVEHPGFVSAERFVELEPGQVADLRVDLEAEPEVAHVYVTSEPEGLWIRLASAGRDDVCQAPCDQELSPGVYAVALADEAREERFMLAGRAVVQETSTLRVRLRSRRRLRRIGWAMQLVLGVVVPAVLFGSIAAVDDDAGNGAVVGLASSAVGLHAIGLAVGIPMSTVSDRADFELRVPSHPLDDSPP